MSRGTVKIFSKRFTRIYNVDNTIIAGIEYIFFNTHWIFLFRKIHLLVVSKEYRLKKKHTNRYINITINVKRIYRTRYVSIEL